MIVSCLYALHADSMCTGLRLGTGVAGAAGEARCEMERRQWQCREVPSERSRRSLAHDSAPRNVAVDHVGSWPEKEGGLHGLPAMRRSLGSSRGDSDRAKGGHRKLPIPAARGRHSKFL